MLLPVDVFKSEIYFGRVFYFRSDKLISSEPHYFICVCRTEDDMAIMVCCTSQFEKRKTFIENTGLPFSTLVRIRASELDSLTMETFVDCNFPFNFSIEELCSKYENSEIDSAGEINIDIKEQIINGMKGSTLIEQSLKDILPKLEG